MTILDIKLYLLRGYKMRAWHVFLKFWLAVFLLAICSVVQAETRLLNKGGAQRFDVEMRQSLGEQFAFRLAAFDTEGRYLKRRKYSRLSGYVNHSGSLLLLDWHPFGGHFRSSLGLMLKHHQWNLQAEPYVYQDARTFTFAIDKTELENLGWRLEGGTLTFDQEGAEFVTQFAERFGYSVEIDSSKLPISYHYDGIEIAVSASGIPDHYTIEIPEISLDAEEVHVSAEVEFQRISPYLGFGWSSPPQSMSRVYYSFDVGVIINGAPDLKLGVHGKITDLNDRLSAALASFRQEQEQELRQSADEHKFFPYVSFGLSIYF